METITDGDHHRWTGDTITCSEEHLKYGGMDCDIDRTRRRDSLRSFMNLNKSTFTHREAAVKSAWSKLSMLTD